MDILLNNDYLTSLNLFLVQSKYQQIKCEKINLNVPLMFNFLGRKSSDEATKERQTFFNLLKDAQVLQL